MSSLSLSLSHFLSPLFSSLISVSRLRYLSLSSSTAVSLYLRRSSLFVSSLAYTWYPLYILLFLFRLIHRGTYTRAYGEVTLFSSHRGSMVHDRVLTLAGASVFSPTFVTLLPPVFPFIVFFFFFVSSSFFSSSFFTSSSSSSSFTWTSSGTSHVV